MSVVRDPRSSCHRRRRWRGAPRAQTFPDYTSTTVNDFADLLPDEDERALAQRLARLERETGVELTVVTLPTQADLRPRHDAGGLRHRAVRPLGRGQGRDQ
jgi:hypothetical protein